jgi:hypothetical protein
MDVHQFVDIHKFEVFVRSGGLATVRLLLMAFAMALLASPAWADTTIVPDPTVTPGAVRTTDVALICSTGTRELRTWSRDRDDRIMAEYGLPPGPHPQYEIDHLVPACA